MALKQIDKININGILKNNLDCIKYQHFFPKNKKVDYTIEEVIDYLITINQKRLETNDISYKSFNKTLEVMSLLLATHSRKEEIQDILIIKIKKMSDEYYKKVEDNLIKKNEQTEFIFEQLNGFISLKTNDKINDDNIDAIEEKLTFEARIKSLQDELDELKKTSTRNESTLTSTINKKKNEIEKLKNEIKELQDLVKQYKKEIKNIDNNKLKTNKVIENLNKNIEDLNKEINDLLSQIEHLHKVIESNRKNIEQKEERIKEQDEEIKVLKKEKRKKQFNEEKLEKIKHSIFKLLYRIDNITLDEIYKILNRQGYDIEKSEIFRIIMELKTKYLISKTEDNIFSLNKKVITNKEKTLSTRNKELDVLIISDYQINGINKMVLNDLDAIFEYCINNNIQYILYLGNLIRVPFLNEYQDSYGLLKYTEKTVINFCENYPYAKGINSIVLGSNRELSGVAAGINPLSFIEKERYDFTQIGFNHGILNINNNKVFVHAKRRITETDKVNDLENYYQHYSLIRKETYLDIIGLGEKHFSDINNSYIIVPSLNNYDHFGECTHIKFIIDDNNNIVNTYIMQLIRTKKLLVASQIQYRK